MRSATQEEQALAEQLERLIGRMVESPQDVHIQAIPQRSMTVFRASVARHDLGKVIGRQGRTVRALRQILEARAELDERRYDLEIHEPEKH